MYEHQYILVFLATFCVYNVHCTWIYEHEYEFSWRLKFISDDWLKENSRNSLELHFGLKVAVSSYFFWSHSWKNRTLLVSSRFLYYIRRFNVKNFAQYNFRSTLSRRSRIAAHRWLHLLYKIENNELLAE